jgi:hypothetical protein
MKRRQGAAGGQKNPGPTKAPCRYPEHIDNLLLFQRSFVSGK